MPPRLAYVTMYLRQHIEQSLAKHLIRQPPLLVLTPTSPDLPNFNWKAHALCLVRHLREKPTSRSECLRASSPGLLDITITTGDTLVRTADDSTYRC